MTTKLYNLMKKTPYEIWLPYKKTGRVIFIVALVMLLFNHTLEGFIYNLLPHTSKQPSIIGVIQSLGLTLIKILLFLMNFAIVFTVFSPIKNEDERIEKIRNYAFRQTFRMIVATALGMGLIIKHNPDLLFLTLIMQGYYLLLFHLCLYRDSAILYLDEEQLQVYGKKMRKQNRIVSIIVGLLIGGVMFYVLLHNPSQYWLALVICMSIISLLATVQVHWGK